MHLEIEIAMLKSKVHYLETMLEATIRKIDDNQPERSKREDFYCIYCRNFVDFGKEQTFCSCGKANEIRKKLYNERCGALNTMET